ncbi:MAG: hypothetical protein KH284_00845 [Clostridiales bacterium]|nr:hypothetical protein [Clostridiales bacterium]
MVEICKICGTPLQPGKIDTIQAKTGEKCICSACSTQVKALMNQADPSAAAAARGYFEQCRLRTTDPEVQAYLAALCGEMPTPKPPNPHKDYWGAGAEPPPSANAGMESIDSSFWITCLKVIMAVLFFAILLGGGILAFTSGNGFLGFLILIFSLLLAIASVTGGMVLLHIAEDVSAIRDWISHNQTDRQ